MVKHFCDICGAEISGTPALVNRMMAEVKGKNIYVKNRNYYSKK